MIELCKMTMHAMAAVAAFSCFRIFRLSYIAAVGAFWRLVAGFTTKLFPPGLQLQQPFQMEREGLLYVNINMYRT